MTTPLLSPDNTINLVWYVVRTNFRQEERVLKNLDALHVETFAPKMEEYRYPSYSSKPSYVVKPLFPNYIFARFDARTSYRKVRFTRGVNDIVSFGAAPAPVDDEILLLMKSRINEKGLISIDEGFKEGDEVTIRSGPLKNFNGIFVRGTNDAERVMILLNSVNYQAHIEIERDFLVGGGSRESKSRSGLA